MQVTGYQRIVAVLCHSTVSIGAWLQYRQIVAVHGNTALAETKANGMGGVEVYTKDGTAQGFGTFAFRCLIKIVAYLCCLAAVHQQFLFGKTIADGPFTAGFQRNERAAILHPGFYFISSVFVDELTILATHHDHGIVAVERCPAQVQDIQFGDGHAEALIQQVPNFAGFRRTYTGANEHYDFGLFHGADEVAAEINATGIVAGIYCMYSDASTG